MIQRVDRKSQDQRSQCGAGDLLADDMTDEEGVDGADNGVYSQTKDSADDQLKNSDSQQNNNQDHHDDWGIFHNKAGKIGGKKPVGTPVGGHT